MKTGKDVNANFVLEQIRQARVKEELAIPIYSSHIQQTLFWSGLAPDKQAKIIKGLKVLEHDSEIHAGLLKLIENNYLKAV